MDNESKKIPGSPGNDQDKLSVPDGSTAAPEEKSFDELIAEVNENADALADSSVENTLVVSEDILSDDQLEVDGSEVTFADTAVSSDVISNEGAENINTDGTASDTELSEPEPPVPFSVKLKAAASKIFERCGFPDKLLLRILGVYLIISGLNISSSLLDPINQWKEFVQEAKLSTDLMWLGFGFVMLTILHFFMNRKYRVFDQLTAFAGVIIFMLSLMWRNPLNSNDKFYLCIGVTAVAIILVSYIVGKTERNAFEKMPNWLAGLIVFTAAAAVTAFVAATTVAHHKTFGTSCFDFGIFVQMFHSMSSDLTAVTTCERDTFLSHFNVHASFIYYLLAPIYAVFPHEETLLIAQAVLAMGGIVPLFLIAKKHDYKGLSLVFVCMIYIFCAGILSPCYYDFHENAFLPTLLMWLLYAMDQRKYILFYIMSILVCIVKEDAPLYVMCIALYFLFNEKTIKRLHGLIITGLSGAYFFLITNWLTENGDGQMMAASRFGNLTIEAEDGFVGIIKNVLINPAYFFSEFLSRRGEANTPEEMLIFFLQIMMPLLFLPFMTKKIHRFLLIIPFVIMNLVVGSGYGYASSIGYQYIFGPSCLLIYMLLINCGDAEPEKRNIMVTASAVASFIMSITLLSGNIAYYENWQEKKDYYQELDDCLDTIPEDAAVAVNTWYLPHIADRDEVYILDGGDFNINPDNPADMTLREMERYDFFVMNYRDDYAEPAITQLTANGFTLFNEVKNSVGHIVIYASPEYSAVQ
ncbi:MAG: DUF2079 domain-containing protein [Ruminococcus sp.]|nr:DUF2079 domain-containing protein [Ruminococcus sp.]